MKPYYADDAVTIYHGDCREIVPAIGDVDAIFTSPPYNKGRRADGRNGWTGIVNRTAKAHRFRDGYGADTPDDLPWDEYQAGMRSTLGMLWNAIRPAGALYLNHKPRVWMGRFWNPANLLPEDVPLRQIISWVKGAAIDISERGFATNYEWVMFCPREGHQISLEASARGDVWIIPQERSDFEHPATFPVALPKRAIAASPAAQLWLDPFAGTGSTLRAAADLGRKAIGIEIEERYCEIAARRMSQTVMAL